MEFPIWLQVICYIGFAIFIIWMIRGVYVNLLSVIFEPERNVKAVFVQAMPARHTDYILTYPVKPKN